MFTLSVPNFPISFFKGALVIAIPPKLIDIFVRPQYCYFRVTEYITLIKSAYPSIIYYNTFTSKTWTKLHWFWIF